MTASIGVPVAAACSIAGILLSPMFAGAAMALSSFTVVLNALGLNAAKLRSSAQHGCRG